jgi:L-aminopeptidase/D-esterase-like protein
MTPAELETMGLCALEGVRVGHAHDVDTLHGCTVVMFDKQLPVAFKAYGGGVATMGTDALGSNKAFWRRRGLFMAGGSMTGLRTGTVLADWLVQEDELVGNETDRTANVLNPAVAGAVIFDLGMARGPFSRILAQDACGCARVGVAQRGNVGVGVGACVGKFAAVGPQARTAPSKSGLGTAVLQLPGGVLVAAMSVVNAYGNVIGPDGQILCGNRDGHGGFVDYPGSPDAPLLTTLNDSPVGTNTTISIVGINVDLEIRENYEQLAHQGSLGQSRALRPVNTAVDGDCVFVFSTTQHQNWLTTQGNYRLAGGPSVGVDVIGNAVAEAVQASIYDAVYSAESITFAGVLGDVVPGLASPPTSPRPATNTHRPETEQ